MTAKLSSEDGRAWYAKRRQTIESVFGQLKEQQGAPAVPAPRHGRLPGGVELLCGTHNLLKLWRHTAIQQAARPATT